jgi:hypothetical protein
LSEICNVGFEGKRMRPLAKRFEQPPEVGKQFTQYPPERYSALLIT